MRIINVTLKLRMSNLNENPTGLSVTKEFFQSVPAGAVEFRSFVQGGPFGLEMINASKLPRLSWQRAVPASRAAKPVPSSNAVGAALSSGRKG